MYALLIYSLKAGACLAVFYLFFKLLLSRETLHRFNRFVVLAGMLLAFALPLCVVTVHRELPQQPEITFAEEPEPPVILSEKEAAFDWKPLLGALFAAGAVGMLLWTLHSLACVLRMIRSGRRERLADGTILVRVEGATTPFSWGRHIVISEEDMALSGREILLHEQAHLHLHHSVDLLATDLAGCLQWFNPAMWLLRRELRAIHEYEADRAVLEHGVEARDYQLLLIRKAVGGRWYSVANSFNHSKLKNRITMMLRKKSSRWTGARALFVVPLAVAALGAFAETVYVVPDDKVKKESVTVDVSDPEISTEDSTRLGIAIRYVDIPEPDTSTRDSTRSAIAIRYVGDPKPSKAAPLYIVDGQEVASLDNIDPERIASVDVYKKDSETAGIYGDKGRNGVVAVTLKKSAPPTGPAAQSADTGNREIAVIGYGTAPKGKIRYIVDGAAVDNIDKLRPDAIKSITVIKSDIPEEYKKQGYDGMVVVTTKNGSDELDKIDAYFNSDEWKQAQKKMAEANDYFQSDEWEAAMQRLTEAGLQTAEALQQLDAEPLDGQTASTRAGSGKEQQDESGATHATVTGLPDDCLIFINGKRSTKARMAKISSWDKIRSMTIYKGQQAIDKFGPEAAAGVIDIKVRK